jgi:DNA repair protein RecO (recombination protein O)
MNSSVAANPVPAPALSATPRARKHDEERGYVLHTYPYSETSLIVEVFTRTSGRVPLVAKGARRSRSGALMQFQPFNLSWSGRGDLRTLKKAEWQGGLPPLSPARLFCGFYLNELILKLLARDDAHEGLFDCYENTLGQLACHVPEAQVLRTFEKSLLKETGYALVLTHDTDTGELVDAGARYAYIPGRGPRRLESRESYDVELAGQTLLDIEGGEFAHPRTASEAKQLMRMLIQHQMNGRPLATRQVFSQLLEL